MTNRLLVGDYGDGYHGMKLSIPGYNVLTANDQQLVFDTKWLGAASIYLTGTTTVGTGVSFSSLGYVPMIIASPYNGSSVFSPYWASNNPETIRWNTSYYETRATSHAPFICSATSVYFYPVPSGFTQPYTYVRYAVLRLPGLP